MITTDTGEAYENEFHHAIDSPLPAVALNDNAPKIEPTLPNLSGGLKSPPKPANDNDPRKPMSMGASSMQGKRDAALEFDPINNFMKYQDNLDRWTTTDPEMTPDTDWGTKGIMPKVTDLSNVTPSPNIEFDKDGPPMSVEEMDKLAPSFYARADQKSSLGINLEDVQDRIDDAASRTTQREIQKMENYNKTWKQIIPTPNTKKRTSQK